MKGANGRISIKYKMNNILWISTLPSKDKEKEIIENGYTQNAASIAQWYFINEIERFSNYKIQIFNALRVFGYPKYNKKVIERYLSSHNDYFKDINVGYSNIRFLNFIFRTISIKREIKKWCKNNANSFSYVIVYSLHSPFLSAVKKIKKFNPSIKVLNIVPDLPLFMNMSSPLRRMLKKIDWIYIKNNLKIVDGFILYTKKMAEYLKIHNYLVIEGIVDSNRISSKPMEKYEKKTALYTGNLDSRYGIDKLISAFHSKKLSDFELLIYGKGNDLEHIKSICFDNVKYCGYITSEESFNEMKKCHILINPRPTQLELTNYSCPSKMFEYMASGTPVLTTKLGGIPDEYFEYVYTFDNEYIDGMIETIYNVLVLDLDTLNEKGNNAKQFIKNNKNSEKQVEKLLNYLVKML